jgi:hypothetical protein
MTGYNEIPTSKDELAAAGLCAQLSKPIRGSAILKALQDALSDDPHAFDDYEKAEATEGSG